MKNKKLVKLSVIISLLLVPLTIIFRGGEVQAASLTTISDTLSRIQTSVDANHTIEFVTPSGVNDSSDTIILTLDDSGDAYNLSGVDYTDVDFAVDNDGNCDGPWTDKSLGATAGIGQWGVGVNTTTDVITFTPPTDAVAGEVTAGYCVQIEIGTNASGGTSAITNPSSAGTYTVAITGAFGDVGSYSVAIVTDDQIDITASVDPTLEVVIGSNACALGVLTSTYIETCSYGVTVSTNATNGYVSTIVADGLLRNASDDIDNASGGTVAKGVEEYGVGTSKSGQPILQNSACTDQDTSASQPASALLTSPQQFANSSGPVSSDLTTMCHLASVDGATPAGSYAQVATIIVTANF